MIQSRVVIVGGGIAGLAAAYRLQSSPPSPLSWRAISPGEGGGGRGVGGEVLLLESEPRLGGKILTERVSGFVVEGGPDTFLSLKPRGIGLCRDLGIEDRLHGTNEQVRRTYVMRGGRLYELPEGLTGLIPSRFGPMLRTGLISPLGKLRMGLDYLIPPRSVNGDESLAAFVGRRLGSEVYERLVEPLMSGIYAGDGDQLSLAATFPQLRRAEVEHGGLIRGMLAERRRLRSASQPPDRRPRRKWPAFVTPETGLAEIVEALEARLSGVEIRRGVRVDRVEAEAGGVGYRLTLGDGEVVRARAVVLATPAYVTAELVSSLDPAMAVALHSIPHVSTATVSVAYPLADIPRPLDAYGYIVPRGEGRAILACTWTSTKFPHRAPRGYGLMRAFVGRAGQEDVLERDDEALVQMVRDELGRTLGITAAPILQRVFRWPKAMSQYTLGHLDRLAVIEARLAAHPGVFVAGNAYRGIGIPDCIASGERAGESVLRYLEAMAIPSA